MSPETEIDKTHSDLPPAPRRRHAFMGPGLTESERKALADSIAENRETLEMMAKH